MGNVWIEHLMKVKKANPSMTMKEAIKKAKETYVKKK
jgi:hypothetical protein